MSNHARRIFRKGVIRLLITPFLFYQNPMQLIAKNRPVRQHRTASACTSPRTRPEDIAGCNHSTTIISFQKRPGKRAYFLYSKISCDVAIERNDKMSIQFKDYTSKKTRITTRRFYASVWDSTHNRLVVGPYREAKGPKLPEVDKLPKSLEKQLKLDEAALIDAINQGKVQKKRSGLKVGAVAELWLEASRPPVYADSTWHIYKEFYGRYIKDVFEDQPVNKVTAVHIQKYVNLIKDKYSPETVNKCITVLTGLFGFAVDPLKEINVNPVSGIKRMKVPKKTRAVWSEEDVQYFLSLPDARASHYYPMLCVSLTLGARPGEVCGLAADALKDNPPTLRFDQGLNRYGNRSAMKNDQSHQTIPIPPDLHQIIRRHILWRREQQLKNPEFGCHEYLFSSPSGNPVRPDQYSKAFLRLVRKHNTAAEGNKLMRPLPEITLYGLRHTFATNALAKGYDAALISSVMRNSVKTMLTFYAHPDQDQQRELITDMAADMGKKVSGIN